MHAPLLSIITITKDDPTGLARTLNSISRWREHAAVEHIVVYRGKGPPSVDVTLKLRCQSSNGIAGAFNEGLDCARGEWVWFLNGGDEIDPRLKPAWLIDLLSITNADVLIGGITYAGETGIKPHPPTERRWPPLQPWIPHPATLVRCGLFERFGRFEERYAIAMDFEWWLRALSSDVKVDVLSLPFAIFAGGGISQRAEGRSRVQWEKRSIVRRHALRLWRGWLLAGCRLFSETAKAQLCRRRNEVK